MTQGTPVDLDSLARRLAARAGAGRIVTAIAGAPGSGKSTLAERLAARLDEAAPGIAAVLPMDGYHYDDGVLVAWGLRARTGAPDTFDVGGLLHILGRLRRNEEDGVAVPVFDRALELSRAGARLIPRGVRHIVVEGNYLLLRTAPWAGLHQLFDATVMAVVPEAELRARLAARWSGYGLRPEEVTAKLEENDLPNGRFVVANSVASEFTIANV